MIEFVNPYKKGSGFKNPYKMDGETVKEVMTKELDTKKNINVKFLSWDDICTACHDIKSKIETIYNPDVLISIGRGGMIPTRILADLLDINDVYMYSIKLYKGIAQRNNRPTVQSFNHNIEQKNILLVDDIMDSGTTIETVIQNLKRNKPKNIRTATILCKTSCKRQPTFYSKNSEVNDWIVFPWEIHSENFKI